MSAGLRVFFSHRVEVLYERVKERLFREGTHPFARRMVVVPSPAMKMWLHLMMAKDPYCGVAAGLEVGYVDQMVRRLLPPSGREGVREASLMELALLLEKEIAEGAGGDDAAWEPIRQFTGKTAGGARRTSALALLLARLFEKYGLYGRENIQKWSSSPSGWQEMLWQRVWQSAPSLQCPVRLVEEALTGDFSSFVERHTEVHVFAASFLPALYHRFFLNLSEVLPVHYYVLSPCRVFWSDIKSDSECQRLFSFWKKKGASEGQLSELEAFLLDRNPLLANFGVLGREMAGQLEAHDSQAEERYFIHGELAGHPAYENLVDGSIFVEERKESFSLLDAVQADLTLLRNPLEFDPVAIASSDRSIQIHVSPTRRREIENLYNTLMGTIDRSRGEEDPVTPADIIVMAPDLMEFEPYIKSVFGDKESLLDFQLMEVELLVESPFVRAFVKLLEAASSRWDAASLIELLELPTVRSAQKFRAEDVAKFRGWAQEAGIRWGEDSVHRNEILQRELCANPLVDEAQPGTWEAGFDRLLAGLALMDGAEEVFAFAPLDVVVPADAELLGRWIVFLKGLRADLKPLQDGTSMTMESWAAYLKALVDVYLCAEKGDKEALESRAELIKVLDSLGAAGHLVQGHLFAYPSVKAHLERALQEKRVNYREGHLQAVRFCSLLPMRALPAKVVALIGMQDRAFPKRDSDNGLNLLKGCAGADFAPTRADFDRSLFLEAILSARKHFILSYAAWHDGSEEPSSVLVSELLAYLDSAYDFQGKKASEVIVYGHPFHSFDASYFQKGAVTASYSQRAYKAACAYYSSEKLPAHAFISDFLPAECCEPGAETALIVNIKDLAMAAKKPLKPYFNKTLGIYISDTSKRAIESDETFVFEKLDLFSLKEKSLYQSPSNILTAVSREGKLPAGVFKDLAKQQLADSVVEINIHLKKMGAFGLEVFTLTFAEHCETPAFQELGWLCPPLTVVSADKIPFKIVGRLQNVCSEGLLVFKKGDFNDLMGVWSDYLVLNAAIDAYSLPIRRRMLPLKDGKEPLLASVDHLHSLQIFLDYYLAVLKLGAPLIPDWTEPILKNDREKFEKIVKDKLTNKNSHFYDAYAKWGMSQAVSGETILTLWHEIAKQVYGPLSAGLERTKGKKDDE